MRLHAAVLVLVSAITPALALDPGLLNFIGSDANAVAGIYVDRVANSQLGVFLQSQLQANGAGKKDLDKFILLTGFDPRKDLREVILASPGGAPRNNKTGLIVARGVFNGAQIGLALQLFGGAKESYSGVDVYRTPGKDVKYLAFPEPSIVVAGSEEMVKAALDRRAQASSLNPALSAKILSASGQYDLWFAGNGQAGAGVGPSQLPVDLVSGGVTLGSLVQLNAEVVMRDEKDAQGLAGMIKMVLGVLQMQAQRDRRFQGLSVLQNVQTTIDGAAVRLALSAPENEIEEFIRGVRGGSQRASRLPIQ